tara:strand:+ start:1054 stop:1635 length:582 start_codon:yes stop_codon:yes gene_type:complete
MVWRGSALQLQIERKFLTMKFNFNSNKAASAARDAMMTIISIVTLSFHVKNGWSVMATTVLGGGVTRNSNFLGFTFSKAELKKAIKEAHARNKRVQPACASERTTPCYSYELQGNMLIVEPVFPADIVPHHDKVGEGFQVKLTHPVGTDASALEIVNALKAYDPAEPKRGELIFSQHCVYNAGQLLQLAKALA